MIRPGRHIYTYTHTVIHISNCTSSLYGKSDNKLTLKLWFILFIVFLWFYSSTQSLSHTHTLALPHTHITNHTHTLELTVTNVLRTKKCHMDFPNESECNSGELSAFLFPISFIFIWFDRFCSVLLKLKHTAHKANTHVVRDYSGEMSCSASKMNEH